MICRATDFEAFERFVRASPSDLPIVLYVLGGKTGGLVEAHQASAWAWSAHRNGFDRVFQNAASRGWDCVFYCGYTDAYGLPEMESEAKTLARMERGTA